MRMTEAEYEVLLNRIAMVIDPEAFETFDNMSPTEREIWNDKRGCRQGSAGQKARDILELINIRPAR